MENGIGYISVAVIKIPDKKQCKEDRAYLAYDFREDKSLHDMEGLVTDREGVEAGTGSWLITFRLHAGSKEREQGTGPSFKAQVQTPPYPNPVTNPPHPKGSIIFPNSATN